ncbi:hypothetical protein SS50377_20084 [Spironucleus salmonicida]|uniref:Protein kinase domain-containing protein n=1 Tax=Spironucleus salmonicida TaxID=348837 RepID=V6LXI9_9EUKA|nr:hypothetical protein SS50377_20084 [Spironucleus salmonicida]|eukprot:EST49347.1 hypothetical protein SS50377_10272 [Spironucleus salmonicida]
MCINCYETLQVQITDDGWVPVKHIIHTELLLAAVILPINSQDEYQFFEFVAKYLKEAQLPFIQTIYDFFVQNKQLILIVRRPQITLNDFLYKSELTDNQLQLAVYSIAMGVFMAHKHKLYVGSTTIRDVLIFEDQYICLSVKKFFKLPCSCWTSKQDLINIYKSCISLVTDSQVLFLQPLQTQTCDLCDRLSYDTSIAEQTQNSANSQYEMLSVHFLCQVILQEMNWPKIMKRTFLLNARISPNVDNSKYFFDDQPCQFMQPKNRHKKLDNNMYKSQQSGIILQTGIRNRNQSIIPNNLYQHIVQISEDIQENENTIISILDPSYIAVKQDQGAQQDQIQSKENKQILSEFLQSHQYEKNSIISPLQQQQQLAENKDSAQTDKILLNNNKLNVLKQQLVEELGKEELNLDKIFLQTRLVLQHYQFVEKMNDQQFPLDIKFQCHEYNNDYLFNKTLLKFSIDDVNYLNTINNSVLSILDKYEDQYQVAMSGYTSTIYQQYLQLVLLQNFKKLPAQLQLHDIQVEDYQSVDQFQELDIINTDINLDLLQQLFLIIQKIDPQLYEFCFSEQIDSQSILQFIDRNINLDRQNIIKIANILNIVIDIIFTEQCTIIISDRKLIEDYKFHVFFNFRNYLSCYQNTEQELKQQKLFYNICIVASFYLIQTTQDKVGYLLLKNIIYPTIFQHFTSQYATYFCQSQLFSKDYVQIFKNDGYQIFQDDFKILNINIQTICGCSMKKVLCTNCKNENNKIILQKQQIQYKLFQSQISNELISLILQLIIDSKRYFQQQIFNDPVITQLVTKVLSENNTNNQKAIDIIFEVTDKTNSLVYKTINSFTMENCSILNIQLLIIVIEQNNQDLDPEYLNKLLEQIILNILKIESNQTQSKLLYQLLYLFQLLLAQVINIFESFILKCEQNCLEQLIKSYINTDFNDVQQIIQNVFQLSPSVFNFVNNINDSLMDNIVTFLNSSSNKIQRTSIFNTKQQGFLEPICRLCTNIIIFNQKYQKLVGLQAQIQQDNKQLLSSISITQAELHQIYPSSINLDLIIQLLNLLLQNQFVLQYGLSFQIILNTISLGKQYKLDLPFLEQLFNVQYLQQLIIFYPYEEVELFYVYLLLAVRTVTVGQFKNQEVEKVDYESLSQSMSVQYLNNQKLAKTPSSRQTKFGQSLHSSIQKSTIEEIKLVNHHTFTLNQQFYNFVVQGSQKLGKIFIDSTVAFLSEQSFQQNFILDDNIKPFLLGQSVIQQYYNVFLKLQRLPDYNFLRDLIYFLLLNLQQQKIKIEEISISFLDFIFQIQLQDDVLKSLLFLTKQILLGKELEVLNTFGDRILALYSKPNFQSQSYCLFYTCVKSVDLKMANIENIILNFYKANIKKFNQFNDEHIHDILILIIYLFENNYYSGFIESGLPLELLQTINMRSRPQLKDLFLQIFNLSKLNDEVRSTFKQIGIQSYLLQTKLEPYQKIIVKQLMADYKK